MVQSFSAIFRQAWQNVWRQKYLWFFGLFVALVTQEVEVILRNYYTFTEQTLSLDSWRELFRSGFGETFTNLWDAFTGTPMMAVVGSILALAIIAVFVWLMVLSIGSLIHSAMQWDQKKPATFAASLAVGRKTFWRNFLILLATKVIDYGVLVLMALLVSLMIFHPVGLVASGLLIVATFIVSLLVSFVAKYASCYVVLKNQSAADAIRSGWQLFRRNWVDSIEMALLTFVINFVVNLLLVLLIVLIAVPFFILILVLSNAEYLTMANFLLGIGVTLVLLVTVIVGSALSSFQFSAWVVVFLRLHEGNRVSRIMHWAGQLLSGQKKRKTVE